MFTQIWTVVSAPNSSMNQGIQQIPGGLKPSTLIFSILIHESKILVDLHPKSQTFLFFCQRHPLAVFEFTLWIAVSFHPH